jgi:hypothetical protein
MLLNIHIPKQSKQCDPQDKEDRVPDEEETDVGYEGD